MSSTRLAVLFRSFTLDRAIADPPIRFSSGYLKNRNVNQPRFSISIFALDEIFGPVLDKNYPAKRGNREKDQPEHQTKIAHLPILSISGFDRKRARRIAMKNGRQSRTLHNPSRPP